MKTTNKMKTRNQTLFTSFGLLLFSSSAFGAIAVQNSASQSFGTAVSNQAGYTLASFDAGSGDKLVVGFGVEAGNVPDFGVTFGGNALTQIITSNDTGLNEFTAIYFLDGVTGVGDIVVTTGSASAPNGFGNGPGFYAVSLSGASAGFETSGRFGHEQSIFGDLTGTLTGVGNGSFVLASFADQSRTGDQTATGDLSQVSAYSGGTFDQIGSANSIAASGFGNGLDLSVTFNDLGPDNAFNNRSNFTYASFAAAPIPEASSSLLLIAGLGSLFARRRR